VAGLGAELKRLFVHLRLHFQLLLAPIFLWGWLVSTGGFSQSVVLAFISFHLFLYSGATAFNSYYDRDIGPVGGLERPPRVSPALLPFALAVKALGWALAALVNLSFFVLYGAFVALSLAYSHPRVRLKGRPLGSLAVVGIGQGALAYLGGWSAARGDLNAVLSSDGAVGAFASVLLIMGLYPLTQIYQMDEDAARGDRTIAVAWGPRTCFSLAIACTAVGGLAMLATLARRFGVIDTALVSVGLVGQVVAVAWLAGRFDPRQVLANYRRVMRLNVLSATALGGYMIARIVLSGSR
jgi:4-hydroxybenzoate polyprenyltransferase